MSMRVIRIVAHLTTLGLLGATAACTADPASAPAPATGGGEAVVSADSSPLVCGEDAPLTAELSSGSAWALCVQVDSKRGMVLRDVHFAPNGSDWMPVAASISVAQLEVPYDHGDRVTRDITSSGFGGLKMQSLTDVECPTGRLELAVPNIGDGTEFGEIPHREVVCSEVTDAGLAYRSEENGEVAAARRDQWTLWSISKVGWYEYVNHYTFGSDGSITPELGATGDLSPVDFSDEADHSWPVGEKFEHGAVSHAHNAVWRIHWSLGAKQRVEQYDAAPTGQWGSESPVLRGRLTSITHPVTAERNDRRWWRIVAPEVRNDDGHPVSYQVDLGATDAFTFTQDQREHGPQTGYDVAFTNHDECQVHATANRGGCGSGVLEFVADGEEDPLTDVVSWVAVGFHHVPRDEDQSPMEMHWQGFSLTPRDLTAQRPDLPDERADHNGQPDDWNGEPIDQLKKIELD